MDRFAIILSGLCLLHCLAVPFSILLGPVLAGWLDETETSVHWLLLALALPVSVYALLRGYRSHRSILTLCLGGVGLGLMLLGVLHLFGEEYEILLTAVGVIALLAAHIRNLLNHEHD